MKHYISTIEDSEVKAFCIMNDGGYVVACDSIAHNDDKFYAEVEKLSKHYNCIKIVEPTFEKRNRTYAEIPHITTCIGNFLKTEKGKTVLLEQSAIDWKLIDELVNFKAVTNEKL